MFAWLAVGLSGAVYVSAGWMDKNRVSALFKLLTVILLIATLLVQDISEGQSLSAKWVTAGLLMSLIGNLIFILSERFYQPAVFVFVVASVCYSKAFWGQVSGPLSLWLPAMLYAAFVILFLLGLPRLSGIALPVVLLGSGLIHMTWGAAEVWMRQDTLSAHYACLGASLLFFCCVGHAFKHEEQPARKGNVLLDSTYFLSQSLITASVLM
ncbi:hypothetical protein CSW98_17035 [Vibrio sp. HA2012]|uniref:lysoplasmalogenase family protein n=1 Tax=Vibrio sp. HA2012 TaxID=1971595 RepID=UPI000C2C8070|nr:lysoplasmalogenase family protein [Vibrio sp. HA2012]PJC84991.1 hypothetical protein CSW98_17035 [Vibrio sp. HA2012]